MFKKALSTSRKQTSYWWTSQSWWLCLQVFCSKRVALRKTPWEASNSLSDALLLTLSQLTPISWKVRFTTNCKSGHQLLHLFKRRSGSKLRALNSVGHLRLTLITMLVCARRKLVLSKVLCNATSSACHLKATTLARAFTWPTSLQLRVKVSALPNTTNMPSESSLTRLVPTMALAKSYKTSWRRRMPPSLTSNGWSPCSPIITKLWHSWQSCTLRWLIMKGVQTWSREPLWSITTTH